MKRVSKTGWFAGLILLLAVGCTQTDVEEDGIPAHALKEVDAGFNLQVLASRTPVTRSIICTAAGTIDSDTLLAAVGDTIQTKAAAALTEEQENLIASLWVGQYDGATGKRLFNQYIASLTGTTVNLKLKQNQQGGKSRVYFMANAGDLGAIADETALKKHTLTYASTEAGLPDNHLCKMMGQWEGEVAEGGVDNLIVELTRLIAKITFSYSTGPDFTFTPSSVVLKNAPGVSQVEAPPAQLADIPYSTYSGTASASGATVYWYLPENMAGTVSGPDAVDSEKKKIGRGVTNATCIELTGDAVQGGVTYKEVTFRFYPGSNQNNYDLIRNSHYRMTVMLVGIDVSDQRITVGEIPPIVVDPTDMPAKKGGQKEIQITARPGQEWVFDMPLWLSALLDGKEIPSGATITYQGPASVVFKAVEANPTAGKREVSFAIDVNGTDQFVTITQSGSTLIKGNDISLDAVADSEGSSFFTATEGLQWLAALGGDGWLDWSATNPGTSGSEAPAGAQTLGVKAIASNPLAQPRSCTITVKAGTSVGDPGYTALTQEIAVKQVGSTATGSTVNDIAAKGAGCESSFTATKGLDWAASVTSGNWISLTAGAFGSPTTGSAQRITFDVAVNPSSIVREGEIIVRAGDANAGPTGTIAVNQLGSIFSVSETEIELEKTESSGSVTVNGTSGLPWTVSPSVTTNGITPATISETANGSDQILTFHATENTGGARAITFTVAVTGGDHSETVKIKQKGNITGVTIDQSVLTAYRIATTDFVKFPPFDCDGSNRIPEGVIFDGSTTITGSYTIQVEKGQRVDRYISYPTAQSYCSGIIDGESGWRLPTMIELYAMYINRATIEGSVGVSPFIDQYWNSSTYAASNSYRCAINFRDGLPNGFTANSNYCNARCVRDI